MTQNYTLSGDGDDLIDAITLEEVKAWLRVEHDSDDDLITSLIESSGLELEAYTGRVLMEQTGVVAATLPRGNTIYFNRGPVKTIQSVQILQEGDADPVDLVENDDYEFAASAQSLYIKPSASLGTPRCQPPILITVLIGYADSSTQPPQPFVTAVKHRVAECYESREAAVELGQGVKRLVQPYKRVVV